MCQEAEERRAAEAEAIWKWRGARVGEVGTRASSLRRFHVISVDSHLMIASACSRKPATPLASTAGSGECAFRVAAKSRLIQDMVSRMSW